MTRQIIEVRTVELCDRCGVEHLDDRGNPGCTGHSSQNGGRACRKVTIRGGFVCTTHGGRSPQVKAAAARRLALLSGVRRAELDRLERRRRRTVHGSPTQWVPANTKPQHR